MATSHLGSSDVKQLLNIVEADRVTFSAAESRLMELIAAVGATCGGVAAGAPRVIAALRAVISHHFAAKQSVTSPVTLLVGSFLLHSLGQGNLAGSIKAATGPSATHVLGFAKAGFGVYLDDLEAIVRDDARSEEELRYKTSSAAGKKVLTGKDALDSDGFRFHLILKSAAFKCLLGRLDGQWTPRDVLSADRAAVDAEVDAWPQSKMSLVEALGDLRLAVDQEAKASSLGGLGSVALTADGSNGRAGYISLPGVDSRGPVFIQPAVPRVAPPQCLPPVDKGDFRPIIAPSMSSMFAFDGQPHPAEWRGLRDALDAGCRQDMSTSQIQHISESLASTKSPVVTYAAFGVSPAKWLELSEKNPQVAATLLNRCPYPMTYLDALVATAAGCRRTSVLLAASKHLNAPHLVTYANTMVTYIRSLPLGQQAAEVSTFAVTLNQLCGGGSVSPAPAVADAVSGLFTDHAAASDVATLWSHVIKRGGA